MLRMLRAYLLLLIFASLLEVFPASTQSDNILQNTTVIKNQEVTNKSIILRLLAFKDIGIRYDFQRGHYIYDNNTLFFDKAQLFLRKLLEDYRQGIEKSLGILVRFDRSDQIEEIFENKLAQLGFTPLREFFLETFELSNQLAQVTYKNLTSDQEQVLATRILATLDKLYEKTYGTFYKQSRKHKYIIMINDNFQGGDALKKYIDVFREVFGMKKVSSMPETFKYFHARAARYSSQFDQDGVIQAIFEAISPKHNCTKYFVEIGGGSEVDNTAYLRQRKNWTGHLFNSGTYYMGRSSYPITNEYVGPLNAVEVFQKYNISEKFDFLSIDVDSRDCFIWSALVKDYKPAVVSIQFNSNFGPDVAVSQPLLSALSWGGDKKYYDKHYGCSSRATYDIATQNGYALVYHHAFTDIFYVRKQLLPESLQPLKLEEVFDAFPIHRVDVQFKKFEIFKNNRLQLHKAKLKLIADKMQKQQTQNAVPQTKNTTKISQSGKSMTSEKSRYLFKSLTPNSQGVQNIIPESKRIPKNQIQPPEITLSPNNKSKVLQGTAFDNRKEVSSKKEVEKNSESSALSYFFTFLFLCIFGALTVNLISKYRKEVPKQNIKLPSMMQQDENNQQFSIQRENDKNGKDNIVVTRNI